MKVIILAAGQGSRMGEITKSKPKPLLDFGGSSILSRLIAQISDYTRDISVVIGYKYHDVVSTLNQEFSFPINFIINKNYQIDINIYSVYLALSDIKIEQNLFIFEADCVYEDKAIKKIFDTNLKNNSCWYSVGKFNNKQNGGIILSNNNKVIDLKIVKKYSTKYKNYNKLIGILKIGKKEFFDYKNLLIFSSKQNFRQYYLQPWIDNLSSLPCQEVDLSDYYTGAFNDIETYKQCIKLFKENNIL